MSMPSRNLARIALVVTCTFLFVPPGLAGARLSPRAPAPPARAGVVGASAGLEAARATLASARAAAAASPSESAKLAYAEARDTFLAAADLRLDELEMDLATAAVRLKGVGDAPTRASENPAAVEYRRLDREFRDLRDECDRLAPGRGVGPSVSGTGAGSGARATCAEAFDADGAPVLPLGWTSATAQGRLAQPVWVATTVGTDAGTGCVAAVGSNRISDNLLDSLEMPVQSKLATVSFRNRFNLERGFDGMVLEISIGGGEFQDIVDAGGLFDAGGYNGRISKHFGSPIAGRPAWTGESGGYVTTVVALPPSAAGHLVVLRWRLATDSGVGSTGASIDSLATSGVGCSVPKGRAGSRPDAPSVPVTFSFTGPPAMIPDGLGAEVPGTTLVVNLPVSGLATSITDVNFRFDGATCSTTSGSTTVGLDHSFVGDLSVVLQSPSGTQLTIINRLSNGGGGNSGNNFCQTLLDDSGSVNIQTQLSGSAPFTGTFLPANALSAFNGEDPNGTWQLRVTDFFIGDIGNVRAFSLVIDSGVVPCTLTCPGDIVTTEDSPGSGMAIVTYPDPTEAGNCQFVFCDPASGSSFPLGTTTVTCSESLGRGEPPFATCSFDITVNPLAACVLTCPANVSTSSDAGQCGAVVKYPPPTATNCGPVTCTPPAASFFPVGSTLVTCTEGVVPPMRSGLSCTFTVTVNDTQAPTITCPANVTQGNDANQCGAVVNYAAPTASDNCPGVGVVCTPAAGSFFPVGTTSVSCTATDATGNTATCGFTVTVNDTQAPAITCPANIVTSGTDTATCALSGVVTYPAPTVSDNCPGVGVPVCVPASGSTFPEGTTTVTCTVADAVGNTATCSFTVTVTSVGAFGACAVDDFSGDTWSIVTDPNSPIFRFWRYRVAATGEVFCGTASHLAYVPSRSLTAADTDDPRFYMNANLNYGARAGTVKVVDQATRRQFVIKDRNLNNNPPCQ